MEKLVYLLCDGNKHANDSARDRLVDTCKTFSDNDIGHISVNVCDSDVATGGAVDIGTLDPAVWAMVSFWIENSDDRSSAEDLLREQCARLFGYLVVESVPTKYTAAPGRRTEGANIVTCIKSLENLDRQEFFRIWYDDHKIVAQQTQSTFGYTRNTIVRSLVEHSPPWDGIVEELFPIGALTNQKVWYAAASDDELKAKQQRMMKSVQRFLDLSQLESHPMSRFFLG